MQFCVCVVCGFLVNLAPRLQVDPSDRVSLLRSLWLASACFASLRSFWLALLAAARSARYKGAAHPLALLALLAGQNPPI